MSKETLGSIGSVTVGLAALVGWFVLMYATAFGMPVREQILWVEFLGGASLIGCMFGFASVEDV